MPFQAGENVGPYRIIQQLGQGGMATVFKAYHPALDRNVAIKVMHPAFMEDPQFQARFEREARVVASLDHPNIVPVYDFAEHGGQPYLVMKYVEGQTLKAVLESRRLTQAEILRIVRSVSAALSYAHKRGVLHRDIKPSNILLTPEGQVYLADFGLARIAEAGQSSLSGDQLLGTPHYISPEQARGERDLDQGTDIYSLGIVLYQLTVGRVPYSADTPFSIIHDHIYTPLPLPRKTNPNLSEALENVLLKALAKDRGDRFAGVEELARAFEAAYSEAPSVSPDQATLDRQLTAAEGSGAAVGVAERGMASPAIADSMRPAAAGATVGPRRRWPWVVGGLALSSLCLLTFAAAAASELRAKSVDSSVVAPSAGEDLPQGLRAAVENRPEDPQARLELARMLDESGRPDEAHQEFLKAVELLLQQGERARGLLEEILRERPQDLLASAAMVEVLREQGRPGEARALAQELLGKPKLPDWLREHLAGIEQALPPP